MALKYDLWNFSGEDLAILRKCDETTQRRFAWIGALVLFISLISFFSGFYSFSQIFGESINDFWGENYFVAGIFALFFAWMVTIIYLLVLYTLSKNVLPRKESKASLILSIAVRLIFLILIAFFVSKPIEVFIFSFSDSQTGLLNGLLSIAATHKLSWLITIGIMGIFVAPFFIKQLLPEKDKYYGVKRTIEKRMVDEDYRRFKVKYEEVFIENWKQKKTFSECYIDPPYNTIKIKDIIKNYVDQEQFLTELYK